MAVRQLHRVGSNAPPPGREWGLECIHHRVPNGHLAHRDRSRWTALRRMSAVRSVVNVLAATTPPIETRADFDTSRVTPPGPLDAFLNPLSDLGEKGVCDTPIQPESLESPRSPNSDWYDGLRCRCQRPTTPQHRLTSGHEPSTSAMSSLIGAAPWPDASRESPVWQHFRCSLLFVVSRRFSVACGVFGGFAFECSTPHRQNPTGRRSGSRPGT